MRWLCAMLLALVPCASRADLLWQQTVTLTGGPWAYHVLAIGDLNYGRTVDSGVALVDPLVDQNAGELFLVPRSLDARTESLATQIEDGGRFLLFFDGATVETCIGPFERVDSFGLQLESAQQFPVNCGRCQPEITVGTVTYSVYGAGGSGVPEPTGLVMVLTIAVAAWLRR